MNLDCRRCDLQFLMIEAQLRDLKRVPGVESRHVEARVRVAREEEQVLSLPSIRRERLCERFAEPRWKGQNIGCHDASALFAFAEDDGLRPYSIMHPGGRSAHPFAVSP